MLTACSVGRDFGRPDQSAAWITGVTTPDEAIARLGSPSQTITGEQATITELGQVVKAERVLVYIYKPPVVFQKNGLRPARIGIFGFVDNRLIALLTISNVSSDQRDFDVQTANQLLSRQDARQEDLMTVLGPPEGRIKNLSTGGNEIDIWYVMETATFPILRSKIRKFLATTIAQDGRIVSHHLDVEPPL